jgi:ATP-dependent DNA ligase
MLPKSMATASKLLGFIPPQLATLVDEPPTGSGWIHEVKHDGYRTCLVVNGDDSRAYTRNGYDWTKRYRPIVAAAQRLPCRNAVLDGEMIVQDETGLSDFAALRRAIEREQYRLVFYVFDLLALDDADMRRRALTTRRACLEELIGGHDAAWAIQFSSDFRDGRALSKRPGEWALKASSQKKRTAAIAAAGPQIGSSPRCLPRMSSW